MYRENRNSNFCISVIILASFTLALSPSLIIAEENNYGNVPSEELLMSMSAQKNIELPFDPNEYNFLIYVPGGSQDRIEQAMSELGIILDPNSDIRGPNQMHEDVTLEDLATHDILIVGWNVNSNTDGLDADILEEGITGRIILSGHDLDYHTVHGPLAAQTTFIQAIDFVLKDSGTGTGLTHEKYFR